MRGRDQTPLSPRNYEGPLAFRSFGGQKASQIPGQKMCESSSFFFENKPKLAQFMAFLNKFSIWKRSKHPRLGGGKKPFPAQHAGKFFLQFWNLSKGGWRSGPPTQPPTTLTPHQLPQYKKLPIDPRQHPSKPVASLTKYPLKSAKNVF